MTLNCAALAKLSATIRVLSAEAIEKAKSGHPGMPLGAADFAAVLWAYYLRFNPKDPQWCARDRFVLSAGHGSMLLYSLLHLFGYDLSLDDIKAFRQLGSKTPGHPEFGVTSGVETSTGPLGQGFANSVGLAISAKKIEAQYKKKCLTGRIFCVVGDGDVMEGMCYEAASLAGHLKLNNLICLYDDNKISIGGSTDVCFTENVPARFKAQGWYVQSIDGHDYQAISEAIAKALKQTKKPSLICAKTIIGKGSPHKANSADCHGAPLGAEEVKLLKQGLGWDPDKEFFVPEDVYDFCAARLADKYKEYEKECQDYQKWCKAKPKAAAAWRAQLQQEVPVALKDELVKELSVLPAAPTRNISGKALQIIAAHLPWLIGGSADLESSNKTYIESSVDLKAPDYLGRNIRYGVREHAMGAIANGLAYTQQWIPFTGTFLAFVDYMRPAIRMAALAKLQTIFVFSHDSFYVGEDGPTHQPIEQINSLRIIPNLQVFRPADGLETALCYWKALQTKDKPSALIFSRQQVPTLEREGKVLEEDILSGGYIVCGEENKDIVLIATGSEVSLGVEVAKILATRKLPARVVSMPCRELFMSQDGDYIDRVIPYESLQFTIEAGDTFGWNNFVGDRACGGYCYGVNTFGVSAPAKVLADHFGFTPSKIADHICGLMR
ncbi:MAG: transketolase [Bdellovibrionota bacterium]|jgi:transketolase